MGRRSATNMGVLALLLAVDPIFHTFPRETPVRKSPSGTTVVARRLKLDQ
jgi:hypothetical protein